MLAKRLLYPRLLLSLLLSLVLGTTAFSAPAPVDPLNSVQWETMYALFFKDQAVKFDSRIKIIAPEAAEDSLQVPVMVDASAIPKVRKLLVFADFNPLPKVLEYEPLNAQPRIGFRFKIQQASPIRVAALDDEGTWHIHGVWIDAAGGGCTLPSLGSADEVWASRLGEVHGRLWQRDNTQQRLRFSVIHPMDTGLADGVPVFYIDAIDISDPQGELLARLLPFEPVSENPVFSLDFPVAGPLKLSGRDNNGNRFEADLAL
jgi:sulfur-oxidizing protein SoxY